MLYNISDHTVLLACLAYHITGKMIFVIEGFVATRNRIFLIINCIFKWAISQNWNFLLISAKIILHFYFSNFLIRCDFELRRTGSFNLNILFIEFKYAYYQFHYSFRQSSLTIFSCMIFIF